MIIASASQFHLPCLGTCLAQCLNSVLNVRALVGAFNQHKALDGAFSVTVKTDDCLKLQLRVSPRPPNITHTRMLFNEAECFSWFPAWSRHDPSRLIRAKDAKNVFSFECLER